VVLREAARDLPPPSFDSIKEQLRMRMTNQRIEHYIGTLRDKADIQREQP
jgi:peptidyl-prolyl cis-trans isomerase C